MSDHVTDFDFSTPAETVTETKQPEKVAEEKKPSRGEMSEAVNKTIKEEDTGIKKITDEAVKELDKPAPVQKHKIKVNGVEMELPLEEIIKRAQMAEGAHRKFEEAAKARREAEEKEAKLNKGLKDLLKDRIKQNPEMLKDVEEFFAEKIQEMQMSPEEKEKAQLKQQLEDYKRQEQERKQAEEQQQIAKMSEQVRADISTKIVKSLDESKLPKAPYTIKRMAEYMMAMRQAGYKLADIDMSVVASRVRSDYIEDVREMFGAFDGEGIVGIMGDTLADKIRQYDIGRIKPKLGPKIKEVTRIQESQEDKSEKRVVKGSEWDKIFTAK